MRAQMLPVVCTWAGGTSKARVQEHGILRSMVSLEPIPVDEEWSLPGPLRAEWATRHAEVNALSKHIWRQRVPPRGKRAACSRVHSMKGLQGTVLQAKGRARMRIVC